MRFSATFVLVFFWCVFFGSTTHQLKSYETQILLQLRKHLEYPIFLNVWENYNGDLCNLSSLPQMSVKCENDSVVELRIMGDKPVKITEFYGFAVPNETLSQSFSIDSFVTTLTRLTSLRVLSLVSLGIWGTLPDKIHRLNSLESLDLSSNFFFGSIPSQISRLVKLQTIALDGNFFNDTIPEWFDSLTNLTTLSLKKNRLNGQVPSTVSRIATLTELALSNNLLTGKLPDLSGLTSLRLLDLRENNFNSELPKLPKGLANIFLSNNSFSGSLPREFGQLNQLQHLDLSDNHFTGTPPLELFALPNISYLNLSSNVLSGSLSGHLKCGDTLTLIDLSDNRFKGEIPNCLDTSADVRIVNIGGNCFDSGTKNQHPKQYCKDFDKGKMRFTKKDAVILAGVVGGVIVIIVPILLVVGFITFCRRTVSEEAIVQHIAPKVVQDKSSSGLASQLLENATYRVFPIEELEEATRNFDESAFLGEGPTGKVYKGRLENGAFVAIRSFSLFRKYSVRNLKLRLDLLSKLHHPHLVGFLGHCIDGGSHNNNLNVNRLFLVYEFVPNGSFRFHLLETSPEKVFKWSDRLSVLIGVAKAVHFLHTGVIPPCVTNKLNTNNILLDEHRIAKLSDYGMSIIADETEKPQATKDGAKSSQVPKIEDDVYNFGVILLESLVGPIGREKGEAFLLNEMTSSGGSQDGRRKIVDPIVLTTSSQESLSIVISITNKCISPEPSNRPSLEDVLWNLQYAAQVQVTADWDQKSDSLSQSELQIR